MKSEYQNHIRESIVFLPSTVIHIPVGVVSPTSLTQESHPRAMQRVSPQVGVGALLRCHSLALTGRACHTPSNSWYSSGFHIFQSAIRSDSICICYFKKWFWAGFCLRCPMSWGRPWCVKEEKRSHLRKHGDWWSFPMHDIEDYNTRVFRWWEISTTQPPEMRWGRRW